MQIPSYPKVFALGHAAITRLFDGEVVIQEKIDGSQFNWMLDEHGELHFRSHHKEVYDGDNSMFDEAVQAVKTIKDKLHPGWVYRAEYLRTQHQNVLNYSRIPKNHLIIFDINTGLENYLDGHQVRCEIGSFEFFETAPVFYNGAGSEVDFEKLKELLNKESILGGTKIEGLVIKNYSQFGRDKHCLMGKWVKEEMKEKISKGGGSNKQSVIQIIGQSLRTEARWNKAVQHFAEKGLLLNEPKDIGPLIKEINYDILEEEQEFIKEKLFKWRWKQISRMITAGFPEWYKEQLAKKQFENNETVMDRNETS